MGPLESKLSIKPFQVFFTVFLFIYIFDMAEYSRIQLYHYYISYLKISFCISLPQEVLMLDTSNRLSNSRENLHSIKKYLAMMILVIQKFQEFCDTLCFTLFLFLN